MDLSVRESETLSRLEHPIHSILPLAVTVERIYYRQRPNGSVASRTGQGQSSRTHIRRMMNPNWDYRRYYTQHPTKKVSLGRHRKIFHIDKDIAELVQLINCLENEPITCGSCQYDWDGYCWISFLPDGYTRLRKLLKGYLAARWFGVRPLSLSQHRDWMILPEEVTLVVRDLKNFLAVHKRIG
jgi:hypothetical protein